MRQPVWALRDDDGNLLATVRTQNAEAARELFRGLPDWARPGATRVGRL